MATTVEERTFTFDTIILDAHGRVVERFTGQAPGLTHVLRPGVGLDMVRIPGGAFLMGSPEGEGYPDERPQHVVTVGPFWMGRFPVTQAQWEAVMGPHRCRCQGAGRPVDRVSWDEAVAFCHRLLRCGAREGALRGRDYRLPTEAEWEYACRAATSTPFHFGPTISTDAANYNGAFVYGAGSAGVYRYESTEVGSFPANAWGLADMHGNVWEWCSDAWHADYVGAPADGCAWDNPVKGTARVARGCSWHEPPEICRSATRLKASPAYGDDLIGFRVAL